MGNKQETKKEIMLNDLVLTMAKEFEKSDKRIDKKIESLAIIVQKGFLGIEGRLDKLEIDVKEVKSDTEDIKSELNKKVDRFTHNDLKFRVEKLEKKFA